MIVFYISIFYFFREQKGRQKLRAGEQAANCSSWFLARGFFYPEV
jgi:hypothetical protein